MSEDAVQLADLTRLTDMLYRAEMEVLAPLDARAAALRADLARLDGQRRAAAMVPAAGLHGMRTIGAEMGWSLWAGRRRAALQSELAMVLAERGARIERLRRAHGRRDAAARLLADAEAARRAARVRREDEDLAALALMRNAIASDRHDPPA